MNSTDHYGNPLGSGSVSVFTADTGTRLATELIGMGPDAVVEDAGSRQTFVLDRTGMDVVAPGFGTLVATQ